MMPTRTSGWPNTARPRAATRMSNDETSSQPPPRAMPSTTAIVATGIVRNRSTIVWKNPSSGPGSASASRGRSTMAPTSAWATKNSGLADRTTRTPTPGSDATSRPRRSSSSMSGTSSRLIGGLSIVTRHTRPPTSTCSRRKSS